MSPRRYNPPLARWSDRANPPSISAANATSRGLTWSISSGVMGRHRITRPATSPVATHLTKPYLVLAGGGLSLTGDSYRTRARRELPARDPAAAPAPPRQPPTRRTDQPTPGGQDSDDARGSTLERR